MIPQILRGSWRAPPASHRMPYGLAIALGVLWAVVSRYAPLARLV